MGGGNRGLHNALNISPSETWFVNPANQNKIYVFADVPHLIKLLRNLYVDQGFILNGKEINKNIIEKRIVFTTQTDLNIAHFMCNIQISLGYNGKFKCERSSETKYATKLFSNTISKAISRCGTLGKFDSENWMECAEFFKVVSGCADFVAPTFCHHCRYIY